jgi:hypothetical protein
MRKNSPRREFLEKNRRETDERDENSERLWPLLLQNYPTDKDTQTIVFRVFHFFFKKGKSIKFFFFDERNTKKQNREKKRTPQ